MNVLTLWTLLFLLVSIAAWWCGRRLGHQTSSDIPWRRRLKGLSRAGIYLLALVSLVCTLTLLWYNHRPQPEPARRRLSPQAIYLREVRTRPRPLVIHRVVIDLNAKGLRFLVTPGRRATPPAMQLRGRTTSAFLREHQLQLAINAQGFAPWYSKRPWDYYPHEGDPVHVLGLAASRGVVYSPAREGDSTLFLASDNRAHIGRWTKGEVYNAVSGQPLLVAAGKVAAKRFVKWPTRAPRTAVGLDRRASKLIIVVVDGRQPNYSEGMTLLELARLMVDYGAYDALNLDGGGSSALVIAGEDGQPHVLNSPIHTRIPGRERVVANHLGVYLR